ncbi:iron-siderophore ABC transporter substrate-binding protein [Rathayibacter sp. SD072]|uniref:iron-siderophore ABC transporter substrate-binding protein n=1 Tax=Rathayibacter sp. SD072 TaxID=2781731 RepID=UPI001A95911F|nr:iron-siderophore ABC transporter substrate-binding protein [Rathayibacter sp. SD072]MBO0985538.1 iron-siderophore ABC transporter substrate-binding protein [Rathayibacter sp. SD072]
MILSTSPAPVRSVRRPLAVPALAAAVLLALTACSGAASSADRPDAESASTGEWTVSRTLAEGMGSPEADGVFPRNVAHYAGSTELAAAPERVAVVSTGQLDALLSLDVVPAAATRAEYSGLIPEYLAGSVDPDAVIADIGERTEPDVEAIAQADPDLILINSVRGADLYDQLSAIAPTVVTLGNGVNWKSDFLLLADALGREGDAQEVLDGLHADAAAFAATLPAEAPTVSFVQSTGDRTRIMGVPSFVGGLAEDAGLARPESQRFDDTSQEISAEQLELADADHVFYAGLGDGLALLEDAALWPTLTAVEKGTALEVELDPFFMNAGPIAARLVLDTVTSTIG